jgi:hypothetical protein
MNNWTIHYCILLLHRIESKLDSDNFVCAALTAAYRPVQ